MTINCLKRFYNDLIGVSSAVQGAQLITHAKDREEIITGYRCFCDTMQAIVLFIEDHSLLFIEPPVAFSYELINRSLIDSVIFIAPLTAGILGIAAYAIDAALEIKKTWRCSRLLMHALKRPHQINMLENASEESYQAIVSGIARKLKPTPQTKKIQAILNRALLKKPKSEKEFNQIKGAAYFVELNKFEEKRIHIDEKKLNLIHNTALHKHRLIEKIHAFKDRLLKQETNKKEASLYRLVGKLFARSLPAAITSAKAQLLANTKSPEAIQNAKKLLFSIQTQAQKMCFIHTLGLIAACTMILSFVLTLFVICPIIPIVIGIIGTLLYQFNYLLSCDMLDNEGWKFSLKSAMHKAYVIPVQECAASAKRVFLRIKDIGDSGKFSSKNE